MNCCLKFAFMLELLFNVGGASTWRNLARLVVTCERTFLKENLFRKDE